MRHGVKGVSAGSCMWTLGFLFSVSNSSDEVQFNSSTTSCKCTVKITINTLTDFVGLHEWTLQPPTIIIGSCHESKSSTDICVQSFMLSNHIVPLSMPSLSSRPLLCASQQVVADAVVSELRIHVHTVLASYSFTFAGLVVRALRCHWNEWRVNLQSYNLLQLLIGIVCVCFPGVLRWYRLSNPGCP